MMLSTRRIKQSAVQTVVGWREWLSLPDLGISKIKAKIDTGARSSSLHAFDVETFVRRGKTYAHFKVHPMQRNAKRTVVAEAEVVDFRDVRSSTGHVTRRPVILTEVELCGRRWPIEMTLANRDEMGFRLLLGRQAVRGRWFVDAGQSYYGGKPKRRKRRAKKR